MRLACTMLKYEKKNHFVELFSFNTLFFIEKHLKSIKIKEQNGVK